MWPSIFELCEKGKEFIQWYRRERLKNTLERTQATRLHPFLPKYLATRHSYPMLSRNKLAYPVAAFACPSEQQREPESVLGMLTEDYPSAFVVNEPTYLDTLRSQGKRLYNAPTYILQSADIHDRITIDCQLGHYFDAMTTCDVLEWEILDLGESALTEDDFASLSARLPLRNEYLREVKDPVCDGTGRSAAVSISTLIVFNDGSSFRAFLRARSRRTAAHSDLYHVVPSFIFQPQAGDAKREFSVFHNIYREYLEEVFGVQEVQSSAGEIAYDWFYSHDKLAQLRQLLDDGGAELLLTGYAVNLLNYRPEICTLLLIKDQDWCRQRIVANWEFLTPEETWERGAEVVHPVEIMRPDNEIAEELATFPGTFVPPGAAAFWLGADVARQRIKDD